MLHFNKLRLIGFKSFVEPVDLLIEKGLTGVVGPNGCGKSNLVDSLCWAMGETSAKKMRGGGMDDVIFGGTADRPQRNIAEVILSLDNTERTAPALFNDNDELEISRRIERECGSTYRINGKEVRARDVQLLFADSATGARSTAIVSQGKIGAIIAAKPAERRAILEEAAGITGLHSRRHEAELRLLGAETNMERLDDILSTLEVQLQNLKKQSRQATRYRNLSGHIRRAEATLYYLRWAMTIEDMQRRDEQFKSAEAGVIKHTRLTTNATGEHEEYAGKIPGLRQTEAEAAARLQRLVLAREALDAEKQRIDDSRKNCQLRLQQAVTDSDREKTLSADSETAIKNLQSESDKIKNRQQDETAIAKDAAEKLTEINEAVNSLDVRLNKITGEAATNEARRTSLENAIRELHERKQRLDTRAGTIGEQQSEIKAQTKYSGILKAASQALADALAHLQETRNKAKNAEITRLKAADAATQSVSCLHAAEAVMTRLEAEEKALAAILETTEANKWPPLIDAVAVEQGYETALGVALGEDLSAPVDEPAAVHWQTLAAFDKPAPLPDGVETLGNFVKGPKALTRRLSQTGVVSDENAGQLLAADLLPGQRLVSRDGGLWRWDGYTVSVGTITASAARLKQYNRLKDVRRDLVKVRADSEKANKHSMLTQASLEQATTYEKNAREAVQDADKAYDQARNYQAELKEKMSEHASSLAALQQAIEAIRADLEENKIHVAEAGGNLAALADPAVAQGKIAKLRTELGQQRAIQLQRQSSHDNLVRSAAEQKRRLEDITRELTTWRQRNQGAAARIEHLKDRQQALNAELSQLSNRPQEIIVQQGSLLEKTEMAENNRRQAADVLAETENKLSEARRNLRTAEVELAQSREQRVRAEGAVEQAKQAVDSLGELISEKLNCNPDELFEIAAIKENAEPPELDAVERRLDRLQRERETMGPVNLRAEQETDELNKQIEAMSTERSDLTKAIEKLRQGIGELNHEGRQRLLSSFTKVDRHFQELFVRLFGGGNAHLALTESDDPLDAGLEIMASPPGKRLQMLSLLSGGEQALTALSLLFAVFLTNPAPICVLDEVDAPLDDANVERFCNMLDEMAAEGRTRFLVSTHHHITMARMDRLFGVTMAERGVSQLVSVDLQQAEQMRETA